MTISPWAGEMAECARQLVLEPYLVLLNDVHSSSPRSEFENLQLFFGAYKSAAIVFGVVFIIVRLFNTFDIIDICVLCVWHDSIKEIYYLIYIMSSPWRFYAITLAITRSVAKSGGSEYIVYD